MFVGACVVPVEKPVWYMANLGICMALHFTRRKIRPNFLICPNPNCHPGWKMGDTAVHTVI